jgi:hypothetical protein
MYWAPQGRYLNVLDPVFLAAANPAVFTAQDEIFSGVEPDVPMRAKAVLDSDFVAYSAATGDPTLSYRLLGDPRVERVHRGINVLFELREPEDDAFVVDWQLAPGEAPLPPAADQEISHWPTYPLVDLPELRALEGYVDGRRVLGPGECLGLVHTVEVEGAIDLQMEFAPMGPSTLWVDGRRLIEVRGGSGAVLGRGTSFPLALESGTHRLSVLTCPDSQTQTAGFYLVKRGGA